MPERNAHPVPPLCGNCRKPMVLISTVPRVTEPGQVLLYQCNECEKLKFVDA